MKNRYLLPALLLFLSAALLWQLQTVREGSQLAARIAPKILRFHVLADSNKAEDQEVKLKVKSMLLDYIYREFQPADHSEDPGRLLQSSDRLLQSPDGLSQSSGKAALLAWITESRPVLADAAKGYLESLGSSDPVTVTTGSSWFPEKSYGSLTLPAGVYDETRVTIGSGRGHNWWCILYPKVCITKDAVATVPESSLLELEKLLTREDFRRLQSQRPDLKLHIRLRGAEFLSSLLPAPQVR